MVVCSCRCRLLALLLAAAAIGSMAASEQTARDLRLVAEARPTGFDYAWSIDGARRTGHDGSDRALAAGAGLRWGWGAAGSPGQWLAGAEALAVGESFGSGGRQGWVVRGEAGGGWSLDNQLMLTGEAFAGGGWSAFTMPGGAAGDRTLTGPTVEFGARAGLRMRLTGPWSIGLEGGWMASRERYGDGAADLSIDRAGGWAGLALGYALSSRPRAID